ncbi:biotin attachment protein [Halobacteriales archaeon QS_3_64_16]|nr:MAG: biotin attachment protein [Halobacteriales archaeon QS_3_64_16]
MNGTDRVSIDTADVWPEDAEDDERLVVNWFVSKGSQVEAGNSICEFQVERVDVDVPSPVAGTIDPIVLEENAAFERGDTLAYISHE